jgi:lipopolysaccharide export system protein LptC
LRPLIGATDGGGAGMMRWLGVVFVLIAAFSVWLFFADKPADQTDLSQSPDGFMMAAHYIQYDDQGQIHMILDSSRVTHFAENNTSHFIQPKVLAYTQKRIPWTITAEEGTAVHDSEQIILSKNVVIHQAPQPDYPETTITTPVMTIYPHRSFAETDQPIVIVRPNTHIEAIGMQADFKSGIFKLLTAVRGTYAPPSKNS